MLNGSVAVGVLLGELGGELIMAHSVAFSSSDYAGDGAALKGLTCLGALSWALLVCFGRLAGAVGQLGAVIGSSVWRRLSSGLCLSQCLCLIGTV